MHILIVAKAKQLKFIANVSLKQEHEKASTEEPYIHNAKNCRAASNWI